jgi:hypothetical protein
MSTASNPLDALQLTFSCPVSWDDMKGTDQVRFCPQCGLNVYNLSGLTRQAAEALIQECEGRLCVRFYRRPDGAVITRDCRPLLQAARRRLALCLGLAATLLLGLLGWAGYLATINRDRDPRARGLREVEPFRTVLERIDPTPVPTPPRGPVLMGVVCPPQQRVNP